MSIDHDKRHGGQGGPRPGEGRTGPEPAAGKSTLVDRANANLLEREGLAPSPARGVQRKSVGAEATNDPAGIAAAGTRGANAKLPFLDTIQRSFGLHDLFGVRAQIGGPASQATDALGANAYAQGDSVAFASSPDLHTAAHEATHVVQQRSGVQLESGLDGGRSDPYERHADAVADAVVRGESVESLLDAGPTRGGGAGVRNVQRKAGETDTSQLPDDKNFLVLADGSVLVRTSWLLSDPSKQTADGGDLAAPARMAEILDALRASHLHWIDAAQIPDLSRKLGISGVDSKAKVGHYAIAFSVYRLIGPPPGADVVVASAGSGLETVVRQSIAVPGNADTSKPVELSAQVRDKIVTALERFTALHTDPSIRNRVINGNVHWPVKVDPSARGIAISFPQHAMEQLFGVKQWQTYLEQPRQPAGTGVLTGKDGGEPRPHWLPKGALELTPKLARYVTGASIQVEVKWDLGVHPQAGFILLPNHCDYEWTVRRGGQVVDRNGMAFLFDNRSTSLQLDGEPGTYEVSVVATSEHFLTPDHKFRASLTLQAIEEKQADKEAFDKAAVDKGPFVRDAKGGLHLKPKQHAQTVQNELQNLAFSEGTIDALAKQGKLTDTDHDVLAQELAKQRTALEEIARKTAGGAPYIVRGTFVSREDSSSTQLRVMMHMMDRGTQEGQGQYSVLLHDTTFGAPTQHPGAAQGPVAKDVSSAYAKLEVAALEDMADHFHAHNDLPDGTVHLAAQQLTSGNVWEATRDTANGRKTAKKILGGAAMIGGVALLFIPGGGIVSAAVFAVTAAAGAASVGLEIEDRIAKEGELKFDRRLALDILQVISIALPFGTMTRVLAEASMVAKAGYLLAMSSVDVAQGFLITADVREQLRLIDANTAFSLASAKNDDDRKQILADRDRKVAQVIGGAMVNGSFILISIGSGIKRIATTLRSGASVLVREPVSRLPTQGREAMQQALQRGWFEHTNASGETERVMLGDEERRYLEQELSVKDAKQAGGDPDAEGKDTTGTAPSQDPAKDSKAPTPSTDPAMAPGTSGRVTEPVSGLYESIDPSFTPPGWHFADKPPYEHPRHPGWIRIRTEVVAPDGSFGVIERSYDPKTKTLIMENAFLKDLPSWIEAGRPLKDGKGTPTVAYLTMRQMKMLGAKFGETRTVKMSTIQNIEAVMQLEQMKRDGIPYVQGVAKTHSVTYATTSIQQSGQMIIDVKIDTSGAWPWQLSDMMDHFAMPEAERRALFVKYGLAPTDTVMVNYDIYIDVAPYPKNP